MGRDVVREVVAGLSALHSQRYTLELGLTASIRDRVTRAALEGPVNTFVRWLPSTPVAEVSVCAESALHLRVPCSAVVGGGSSVQQCRRRVLCRTPVNSRIRKSRTTRSSLSAFSPHSVGTE